MKKKNGGKIEHVKIRHLNETKGRAKAFVQRKGFVYHSGNRDEPSASARRWVPRLSRLSPAPLPRWSKPEEPPLRLRHALISERERSVDQYGKTELVDK